MVLRGLAANTPSSRAKSTAFVTDGQLSGLCLKGLTVAEVSPEAATGGLIGKVRNGDTIRISVATRSIDIDVPAAELAAGESVAVARSGSPVALPGNQRSDLGANVGRLRTGRMTGPS